MCNGSPSTSSASSVSAIVRLVGVEVGGAVREPLLERVHADAGARPRSGHREQVAYRDAGPSSRRAPTLDARDRQRRGVLGERAEVVDGERQGCVHLPVDDETKRRVPRGSTTPAATAERFTGKPWGPVSGRRGASSASLRSGHTV